MRKITKELFGYFRHPQPCIFHSHSFLTNNNYLTKPKIRSSNTANDTNTRQSDKQHNQKEITHRIAGNKGFMVIIAITSVSRQQQGKVSEVIDVTAQQIIVISLQTVIIALPFPFLEGAKAHILVFLILAHLKAYLDGGIWLHVVATAIQQRNINHGCHKICVIGVCIVCTD